MKDQQQTISYSVAAKVLHWLMAALILSMIPAGFLMIQPDLNKPLQNALFIFHKNVGVVLLLLIVLRLLVRWRNPPPALPDHVPAWQARIAHASHAALYALMIAMPVAGYLRVRAGGFPIELLDALGLPTLVPRSDALAEIAKTTHYYGAYAIAAFVFAHVLAGFYHGLVLRDGVFSRIWPPVARWRC